MLSKIFISVLEMSFVAVPVILAILVIRVFLRKLPKVISYGLWAVVLFRLLCPFSVTTVFSLIPDALSSGELVEEMTDDYVGAARIYEDNTVEYYTAVEAGRKPVMYESGERYYVVTGPDGVSAPRTVADTWIPVCAVLWLVGIVGLGGYSIFSFMSLKHKLADATVLRDNIYLTGSVSSPFVLGLFRPGIYLPLSLTEQERSYIILHEQHHIRRGDHIVKVLAFLALCIHWFNPLVWLAFSLSEKDMEMSCDEAVIRQMGEGIRADYAASLLNLATGHRFISGTPLAFGEGDVKNRIYNLAHFKKPAVAMTIVAVVVCLVAAICLVSNPAPKADGNAGADEESRSTSEEPEKGQMDLESSGETVEEQVGAAEGNEFLAVFEEPVQGILEGYTEAQSEAIREELGTRIIYENPDEHGITVWMDEATVSNQLASLTFHNDFAHEEYEFVKLDVNSIDPLVMDGNRWIHVTGKAVFEEDGKAYYYQREVLEIMIPVTVHADDNVTLGKYYANCTGIMNLSKSGKKTYEEMGYNAELLHVEMADVTHDGVQDYIVTDMYFPPEEEVSEENLEELVQQYLWPCSVFVNVYDGTRVKNEEFGAPIWVKEFSAAHAGNGQVSVVYKDGLAYLLTSNLWQGQGFVGYDFDVFALDGQGHEYIIAEGSTQFEDKDTTREEQRVKIMEFKEHITPWFEDAVLIIATEVGFEEQLITTERNRFVPEQYYDTRWAQWEE